MSGKLSLTGENLGTWFATVTLCSRDTRGIFFLSCVKCQPHPSPEATLEAAEGPRSLMAPPVPPRTAAGISRQQTAPPRRRSPHLLLGKTERRGRPSRAVRPDLHPLRLGGRRRPPPPAAARRARPPQPLPLPPPQPLPGGGVERTASTVSSVVFPEYCSPTSVSSISSFQNSERSHSSTRATSASIPASAPDLRQAPSPSGTASLLGMAARGEARVGGGRSGAGTERSAVSHVMAAPPPFCRCHSPQTWEGFGPAQGGRRGGEEGGGRGWAGGRGGVCGVV